ncbi:MAG: acetylornithine transaminase [Actinomycetes bacterium]
MIHHAASNAEFRDRWAGTVQSNYGQPKIALSHGLGAEVWDVEGKRYLDFLGGIATNILGHAHPEIVKAISEQSARLSHVSNFYMHESVVKLAEKLQSFTKTTTARTFFCNSGAEANEAALKLSRLTGRTKIVATDGAFHGRTMGALSLTGQPSKRDPFKPLLKGIVHVPFGDVKAITGAITSKTAMVIIEPILGEHGVVVPPDGYLRAIRERTLETGTLFVVDAVQTGMGRTGTWFGYEHEEITPDVITLAKGLGGGLPLGAMIAIGDAALLFQAGHHGTTFGGNPISCAAANAAISVLERDGLLAQNVEHEKLIKAALSNLPGVTEVRGRGLLLGVVFDSDISSRIYDQLIEEGILVNAPNPRVIRIAPPLNVSLVHVNEFLSTFSRVVRSQMRS